MAPTPTPTMSPAAPTSPQAVQPHASCAANFSCFTDINAPGGVGAFARHPSEAESVQNEPHIELFAPPAQTLNFPIAASVRGQGGVLGAPRDAPGGDYIMHIWIVDQAGNTLCHVDSDC